MEEKIRRGWGVVKIVSPFLQHPLSACVCTNL
jgi:hypothetical protein